MTISIKKTSLAAALVAGTALVAPGAAWAAYSTAAALSAGLGTDHTAAYAPTATGLSGSDLIVAPGKRVVLDVVNDAGVTISTVKAYFYNGQAAITAAAGALPTNSATLLDVQTLTITAVDASSAANNDMVHFTVPSVAGATHVIFEVVDSAGNNFYVGANALNGKIPAVVKADAAVNPIALTTTWAGFSASAVKTGASTYRITSSGPIFPVNDAVTGADTLDAMTTAVKNTAFKTRAALAEIAAAAAGTAVSELIIDTSMDVGNAATALAAQTTDTMFRFDLTTNTAFGANPGTFTLKKKLDTGNQLTDLAGNPIVASAVDIAVPAKPAFQSASATKAFVTAATAGTSTQTQIWQQGTVAATAYEVGDNDTVDIVVKMNDDLEDASLANADDFEIVNVATDASVVDTVAAATSATNGTVPATVNSATAGKVGLTYAETASGVVTLRISKHADDAFRITNGELYLVPNGGTNATKGTPIKLGVKLKVGGTTPLRNGNDTTQVITSSEVATGTAKSGIAPAVVRSTLDRVNGDGTAVTPDGRLDGARFDFGQAYGITIAAPVSADFAAKTKRGGTQRAVSALTINATGAYVDVNFTNPSAVDWNEDNTIGNDTALYTTANFGTGLAVEGSGAGQVPYDIYTVATPAGAYTNVFDSATSNWGANKAVNAFGEGETSFADGASPVLQRALFTATSATKGILQLDFSEAVAPVDGGAIPNAAANISVGGITLGLININNTTGAVGAVARAATTDATPVASGAYTIADVSVAAKSGAVTFNNDATTGVSSTTYAGAAQDALADASANYNGIKVIGAVNVTEVAAQPAMQQAIEIVEPASSNFITKVLVRLDKPVQLKAGGSLDGLFTVTAGGSTVRLNTANVDMTNANDATAPYIVLTLPTPGIIRTANTPQVAYASGTSPNMLVLVSDNTKALTDNGGLTINQKDTTTSLYTMDVRGQFDLTGANSVAKGSLVRADLVRFDADNLQARVTSSEVKINSNGKDEGIALAFGGTVPAATTLAAAGSYGSTSLVLATTSGASVGHSFIVAGDTTVYTLTGINSNSGEVTITPSLNSSPANGAAVTYSNVANQAAYLLTQAPKTAALQAWVKVQKTVTGATGPTSELVTGTADLSFVQPVNGTNQVIYPVTLKADGTITGTSITGKITAESALVAGGIRSVDQAAGVVGTDGKFRVVLGSSNRQARDLVLVSVKRPGETAYTNITSAEPSMNNYVSFLPDLENGIGATDRNLAKDLGTIDMSKFKTMSVANTTNWQTLGIAAPFDRNTAAAELDPVGLFIGVDNNGAPVSLWKGEGVHGDQVFNLWGNLSTSKQELTPTTSVGTLKPAAGASALAFKNDKAAAATVSYRTTTAADEKLPAGWSLVSIQANISDLNTYLNQAANANIQAVIQAGAGVTNAKYWWKGDAAGSTLNTLNAGDSVFIYSKGDTASFKFGR